MLLPRESIKRYDDIMASLLEDTNLEHLGEIVSTVKSYDKSLTFDNPALKETVLRILNDLLESGKWVYDYTIRMDEKISDTIPKDNQEVLRFVNDNWEIALNGSYLGPTLAYLVFLKRADK